MPRWRPNSAAQLNDAMGQTRTHALRQTDIPLPHCETKRYLLCSLSMIEPSPFSKVRERWRSFAPGSVGKKDLKRPPAKGGLWLRYSSYSCRPSTANERNFAYFSPTLRSSTYSGLARQARIFSILSQT